MKQDGTAFSSSLFEVPKAGTENKVMINDSAFSTDPAVCAIEKYYSLVETTTAGTNGLSGLTCSNPGISAACRTITLVNS